MEKPTECKWCGRGVRNWGPDTVFQCWTILHPRGEWSQSTDCKLGVAEDRIQRAVDTLKAAKRYTVAPGPRNTLNWDPDPDGYVTDSPAVDEALAILEGERDGKQDE